jgi:uncharacterized OB-fold protein
MAEVDVRKPLPAITSEAKPFWDAAVQNKLLMQHCNDCGAWVWTPRPLCNECGSERVEWTPMSGRGEIYSFTVIRQVVAAPLHTPSRRISLTLSRGSTSTKDRA